jgi:hypothetical protein
MYINICKIVRIMEFLKISEAEEKEKGAPSSSRVCSIGPAGPVYNCTLLLFTVFNMALQPQDGQITMYQLLILCK